jgi:type IV secretory pathway TrbD component
MLGGERKPVYLTALLCAGVAFTALNIPAIALGAGVWAFSMPLWRAMAKTDPQMVQVYIRSLRYKRYYPARSRPFRRECGLSSIVVQNWIYEKMASKRGRA